MLLRCGLLVVIECFYACYCLLLHIQKNIHYSNVFVDEPGIIVIQYLGGDENNSKCINTYSNILLFIY